ncbi:hypothetical protein CDAR_516971 [Caerostris darwini]|uniref:Uncharacterized protein n=1 Tax=Caerostris darwini TaxID=1538125 RepID=A0AAV4UDV5_9ARAC|nr:hypothetical protein CDAR_516971 [Caerostris darwini]
MATKHAHFVCSIYSVQYLLPPELCIGNEKASLQMQGSDRVLPAYKLAARSTGIRARKSPPTSANGALLFIAFYTSMHHITITKEKTTVLKFIGTILRTASKSHKPIILITSSENLSHHDYAWQTRENQSPKVAADIIPNQHPDKHEEVFCSAWFRTTIVYLLAESPILSIGTERKTDFIGDLISVRDCCLSCSSDPGYLTWAFGNASNNLV